MGSLRVLNVMLSKGLGGVEFSFARYSQALLDLGHEVTSCFTYDAPIARYLPAGCHKASLAGSFEYSPITVLSARNLINGFEPDVVLTHGRRAFVTFATARKTLRKDFGLVNVLHRSVFSRISDADRVICVSRDIVANAIRSGVPNEKLVHIPNFVIARNKERERMPARATPTVGFLGRMVREKGLDLLIEALGMVRQTGLPFSAVIGGDGPEFTRLQELSRAHGLSGDIEWRGWTTNPTEFYDDIDYLVVPSRHESFGLVTLEAFNSCRPVLATRTSGSSELIQHGRNGWLCEISPAGIAAGITKFLREPQWAGSLARNAYEDVEGYTAQQIGTKIDACLKKAIKPEPAKVGEVAVQH